jgi:hypothetical protein
LDLARERKGKIGFQQQQSSLLWAFFARLPIRLE